MLNECDDCPGMENLIKYLYNLIEEYDKDYEITCKQ